jgi:hypothetical protein
VAAGVAREFLANASLSEKQIEKIEELEEEETKDSDPSRPSEEETSPSSE